MPNQVYLTITANGNTLSHPITFDTGDPASAIHELTHQVLYLGEEQFFDKAVIRVHKPLQFMMAVEKITPLLMTYLVKGDAVERVEINWNQYNEKTKKEEAYFRHLFENVIFEQLRIILPQVKAPEFDKYGHMAEISFRYKKVTWAYLKGNLIFSDEWQSSASETMDEIEADDQEEDENAPQESEEETDAAAANTTTGKKVKLTDAKFLFEEGKTTFNEDCDVAVNVEFLESTIKKKIYFKLFSVYKDKIQDMACEVSGDEQKGVAKSTVKLHYNDDYYADTDRTDKDFTEYFLKVYHPESDEIESTRIKLPTSKSAVVCHFVEIHDSLFNHNSAIPSLDSDQILVDSLCTVFCHSKDNSAKEIVLYGHADTSGEPSYNYDLSDSRGKAMKALLDNDAEAWLDAVDFASKVEDYQTTLKSLSQKQKWPTDPGTIDNANGPKTIAAVKSFQTEYNQRFSGSLKVDGIMGSKTWEAIFKVLRDLIEKAVKSKTGDTIPSLKYAYGGDAVYACGESFPIEAANNSNYRSKTNRRVEIIFFDEGTTPPKTPPANKTAITKEEVPVYDDNKFKREPLHAGPPAPVPDTNEIVLQIKELPVGFAPSVEHCRVVYRVSEGDILGSGLTSTVTIKDRNGTVVFEKTDLVLEKDKDLVFEWDGKATDGKYPAAGMGPYSVTVAQTGDEKSRSIPRSSEVKVHEVELSLNGLDANNRLIVNTAPHEMTITASVFMRKTDGTKSPTEIPAKVEFSFVDPGAANISPAASFSNLGKKDPASKYWKADPAFVTTSADGFKNICVVETNTTKGSADLGKAKVTFLPSAVGKDDFKIRARVLAPDGTTELASKDSVEFVIWRKITFTNTYTMSGETYIDAATTHAEIGPAFETTGADGAFVLYERGAVNTLNASLTVKYIGLYDAASPTKMANWPADFSPARLETSKNQLDPKADELTDYANTGSTPADIAKKAAAKAAIEEKARLWFNRIAADMSQRCDAWLAAANVGAGNSILAVQYYHPKLSNQGEGATNFYPPGISINLANPDSGESILGHPDRATWRETQGFNYDKISVIFKNYGSAARLQIVCRHEIGHGTRAAFKRADFGGGDHSMNGLMTADGASNTFSNADAAKLRGEL